MAADDFISVDVSDLERQLSRLDRAMATGDHPALQDGQRAGAAAYLAFVREWFLSAGNGTWPPLAEATVKEKRRKGEDERPGFGSGSGLFDSLTPGHPNNVIAVNGLQAAAGSTDPVMPYFHNGTSRGTPARPVFVPPDAGAIEDIAAAQVGGVNQCLAEIFGA